MSNDINTRPQPKKRRGLAPKMIIGIILIAVIISAASVFIGTKIYWNDIVEHYNVVARHNAMAVENVFSPEDLKNWGELAYRYSKGQATDEEVEAVVNDPTYVELKRLTENLNKSCELNDIYIVILDLEVADNYTQEADDAGEWNPFTYIMDTYYIPDMQYPLGSSSAVDEAVLEPIRTCWVDGIDPTETILTYWHKGEVYILTSIHAVVYEGKTVALIGVEIPLPTLEKDTKNFIFTIIIIDVVVLILILILAFSLVLWGVIYPIKDVAKEAQRFVSDNTKIDDSLKTVKTHDEIQTLSESLLSLEYGVRDYIDNITKITAEKNRVATELSVATRIQSDLMATDFPRRDDMDIFASMTPAKEVGGDFYDFFFIDDDHIALVMADVSGKGIPAALVMVVTKTLVADRTRIDVTPAKILEEVNSKLNGSNSSGMFVTLWLGIVTLSTGEVKYANAGHEYPAIRRNNDNFELITASHLPPLATVDDIEYEDKSFTLEKGDCLFLYTDGIPEAKSPDGKRFGTDRMISVLNRNRGKSAETLINDMKDEVCGFAAGEDPFDDLTMLCFVRK